jgi:methylase of polypeptide subunit release factors
MRAEKERALKALLEAVAATGYEFVPPTPETHRLVNARPGNGQARDLRDVFGWSRPFDPVILGPHIDSLLREAGAVEPAGSLWKSTIRIATLDGRHYLHSAFPTDASDAVFFGPDTYRFVRAALAAIPDRDYARAVDLGCGSGAGGLAIASHRAIQDLYLTDINPAALSLAAINADRQKRKAELIQSDLLSALDGDFDLILANPPYLADAAHRAYRDGGGRLGMDLGLRIVREASARLTPGGVLFLYSGVPVISGVDRFRAAMDQILPGDGWIVDYSEIDPDVFGEELNNPAYRDVDRLAVVAIVITRTRP